MNGYFDKGYVSFFKELAQNNNKAWFDDNRKRYENDVKKPFQQFVGDLIDNIKKDDTDISIEPKDAIFRINKDIRFSNDKTPYKLHMAAVISNAGRKKLDDPGLYFHFGVEESFIGGGLYCPEKENLQKIRESIANNYEILERLMNDSAFSKLYKGFAECDRNKVLPKDLKEAGEKNPLLFNKSYYFIHTFVDPEFVLRNDLMDYMLEHYQAGKGVNTFIKESIY